MNNIWDDRFVLADMLFDTNKSLDEIAEYFNTSKNVVSSQIKLQGLDWIRRTDHKVSRGQSALTRQLKKLLPNENIVNEYHIGDRLRIDVYCPSYKLAIEYHGRQHYEWITMFHPTYEDFVRAQERDLAKEKKCAEEGITLVAFRYNDDLSEAVVFNRLLEALTEAQVPLKSVRKPTNTYRFSPEYKEFKTQRNQRAKELRRQIKQERKQREYDGRENTI